MVINEEARIRSFRPPTALPCMTSEESPPSQPSLASASKVMVVVEASFATSLPPAAKGPPLKPGKAGKAGKAGQAKHLVGGIVVGGIS